MARHGWENALDDDVLVGRSSGVGFWSGLLRWLVGLFIVASLTAAAAYYVPLRRAHKALTEDYAALNKRAEGQAEKIKELEASLATVQGERDQLKAAEGEEEAKQQAAQAESGKLRDVLSAKLSGYARAHLSVRKTASGALVLLPPNLVRMQGAEISDSGRAALCAIVKAMSSVGPLRYRVGAYVAHADVAGPGPREQAAGRATSAARAMEEKCAVPATRILAAGFEQPASAASGGSGDVLELEAALLDGPS